MKDESLTIELKTVKSETLINKKKIYLFFKRLTDILIALVGLIPFLLLYIIIKISYILTKDFNPIIYKHERIKKNGETFMLYKFRTMVPNSKEMLEEMLKQPEYKREWKQFHKFENDPRITKIGNILRKTSLDEIPQVLNIIKGDMSLIGPRPMLQEEVDEYKNKKDKLLSVKPGLTGWWAVNGRSCTSNNKRKKLELYYVDHMSVKLDIKIFFMTILKVFKREGAK